MRVRTVSNVGALSQVCSLAHRDVVQVPASLDYMGQNCRASPVGSVVKNLPTMQKMWVRSQGWEDLLEQEMATHSSILSWEIPWNLEGYSLWCHKESNTTTTNTDMWTLEK